MQIYDTSTYQSREHLARLERARVEARAETPGHGQELTGLWQRSSATKEQLVGQLEDWCRRAERSGIAPLQDFSRTLRSYV